MTVWALITVILERPWKAVAEVTPVHPICLLVWAVVCARGGSCSVLTPSWWNEALPWWSPLPLLWDSCGSVCADLRRSNFLQAGVNKMSEFTGNDAIKWGIGAPKPGVFSCMARLVLFESRSLWPWIELCQSRCPASWLKVGYIFRVFLELAVEEPLPLCSRHWLFNWKGWGVCL